MDDRLRRLAEAQGGVFTHAQACAHGYDPTEVARLRRSGAIVRLRRGVYVEAADHPDDARARHGLHARALLLVAGAAATASHASAAVLLGLDLWDRDLTLVHVTRDDRSGSRVEAGVVHHAAWLPPDHVTTVAGLRVTTAARTAVDLARTSTDEVAAVALVDAALRAGADLAEVRAIAATCRSWPGARTAGRAVALADPGCESVGESRTRLQLRAAGYAVRSQVEVRDAEGLLGRVDFLLDGLRVVVEFDGRTKYGVTAQDAVEVLWREKRREDRLRALGLEVVRLVWADLDHPRRIEGLVRAAVARARPAPARAS